MIPLLLVSSLALAGVPGESPRSMVAEAKLGPYTPLIDRVFADQPGPYQQVFGGSPMLLGEVVLEYQFFQLFGSLAAGASIGYAEKFGHAVDTSTGETTSQSTGLKLTPVKAYLVYRFDVLDQRWSVPLVPYLKGGLVVMPWWVTNGPSIEVADNLRGAGTKFGFMGTVGLALTLDFLDARLARDFDTGMGVNHTYVFAEFALQEMTNFATQATGDLDLSSRHWMFGLAFEM